MDKQKLKHYKTFFTITKMEFNFVQQKMQHKKHRLYTRDCLPPTYKDVLDLERSNFPFGTPTPIACIEFKQNSVPQKLKDRFADNIKLQNEIMRIIRKRITNFNYKCGIIKMKTGTGKTHVIMDIIELLQTKTLILVSNKKLMQEMIDKISSYSNTTPTQYGGGKKDIGDITVMTKSSFLLCLKEDLEDFGCILVDELQTGFSKKFRDKMNTTFSGKDIFLYGLSATPSTNELNEKDLQKYYGKTIEIEKEHNFTPEFIFYNYHHLEDYEFEHYAELRGLLSEDIDRVQHQQKMITSNLSNCSLILCDRIIEIEELSGFFYNKVFGEYNLIKITGETSVNDDKIQLGASLKNNKHTIIIGSIQKCATGFDHPPIDTVFLFSAIKFENTVIQAIGRSLRKYPGKTGVKIYVWNDKILDKQRLQKQKAIYDEYGVHKSDIEVIEINKNKKKRGQITLTI